METEERHDDDANGETDEPRTADDTPVDEDVGDEGLGTQSGAAGGEESPPANPDPATKGATKGTEGAL